MGAISDHKENRQNSLVDNRLLVSLLVEESAYLETLVDCGAARSLISEKAWNKIKHLTPQNPRPGAKLYSLSDNIIENKGVVEIEILNKVVPVYIVPSLVHDLLLGVDALRILEAEIYLYKNVIRLNNHSVQGWTVSESDLVKIGEVKDT